MSLAPAILDVHQLAGDIKRRARALGFELVGIADAAPTQYRDLPRRWLADGQAGPMRHHAQRLAARTDPASYLPGARSVICVAMHYHTPLEPVPEHERGYHGRIARSALGVDYHEIIKMRLHSL